MSTLADQTRAYHVQQLEEAQKNLMAAATKCAEMLDPNSSPNLIELNRVNLFNAADKVCILAAEKKFNSNFFNTPVINTYYRQDTNWTTSEILR